MLLSLHRDDATVPAGITSEVIDLPPAGDDHDAMTTTANETTTAVIDGYLAAYGEPDADVRGVRIEAVWAPDGRLLDPPAAGEGHVGIDGLATALQGQFPGHRFRRTSAVDAHHDHVRFTWELVAPDGTPVLAGMDVGRLGRDGRLEQIVGFFGELPAARTDDDAGPR